jgi:uncharacterized protein (DUF362 family)
MTEHDHATVALVIGAGDACYPAPPYSPTERPPEYPWKGVDAGVRPPEGRMDVYSMVRESLRLLGLDGAHYGEPSWDPLGELIEPGNTVLIKPNFVFHENRSRGGTDCLVTQSAVIRPIADYACVALKGKGRIIVGDAPVQSSSFGQLVKISGLDSLEEFFRGTAPPVEIRDFRTLVSHWNRLGLLFQKEALPGDAEEAVRVNLGRESALCPLDGGADRYRVTFYDPGLMAERHRDGHHEYSIARSVLASDVVINVAKMKTHVKAGVTGALKNIVGINTSKEFLPHHRQGAPSDGGDEYPTPSILKRAVSRFHDREYSSHGLWMQALNHVVGTGAKVLARLGREDWTWGGSWAGNDTLWRMVLDLNRIVVYADKNGVIRPDPQRKILCVVDGIVAGEGEGPLAPTPRASGVILAGWSAARVDAVMATVMGCDWQKVPTIREAVRLEAGAGSAPVLVAHVVSNRGDLCGALGPAHCLFSFTPPKGWRGSTELRPGRLG